MTDVERRLYRSRLIEIGDFRCPPRHERFPAGFVASPLAAFARYAVEIEQRGDQPVVADANTVVLYNSQQEYLRRRVDDRGDHCDWIALRPAGIAALTRHADLTSPFAVTNAPMPPRWHLVRAGLLQHVARESHPDAVLVDEVALRLMAELVGTPSGEASGARSTATQRRHSLLVHDVRAYLATHSSRPLSLGEIAAEVGASPFHLSRIFRRHTGATIHTYLTRLRLHAALDALDGRRDDLGLLAVEAGFASHSHFSSSFKGVFGVTPSWARRTLAAADLTEMRKILKV